MKNHQALFLLKIHHLSLYLLLFGNGLLLLGNIHFGEQDAYKWYGWITLVVEDVLVALGLFFGSLRASSSLLGNDIASNTAGFTFGMAIELVFLLLLTEAAWIGAAYLAYKVIYEKSKNFL